MSIFQCNFGFLGHLSKGVCLCINGLKADFFFFLLKATEDTLNVSWMNKLKKNREVKNGGFPGEP